jgi:hypothetical protein
MHIGTKLVPLITDKANRADSRAEVLGCFFATDTV